jgi:DNA-binding NarL/FixJ family response regulator
MDPGGMVDVTAELARAREYYRRQAWADACDAYQAIDRVEPLAIGDLERLAASAHVLGRGDDAVDLLQRVYQVHVNDGETGRAARTAFYLWHALGAKGEFALAGGWIARAKRLVEPEPDRAELGYLLVPDAERQFGEGDVAGAFATASRMVELAGRGGDRDLVAIAVHIQGRARIKQGRVVEGLALLDEALVEITAGATSAAVTSWIYCSVIDACHEVHELRRAREWAVALNAWCDAQPQYTGAFSAVCRIHRAELLVLNGSWHDAVREAQLACDQLTRGYGEVMAGLAHYQLAEVYRLGGDVTAAAGAYHTASGYGGQTQPGLALLWLAQGRVEDSAAAIRRALTETAHPLERTRIGLACRALSDEGSAGMELDAARRAFLELGAVPDAARVQALTGVVDGPVVNAAGLSPRELDVLRLVAAGKSNQAIAAELVISERTVERHMSNIFGKLGVGSRTAAAAYAFEQGIR